MQRLLRATTMAIAAFALVIELMSLFESELFSLNVYVAPFTYVVVTLAAIAVILLSEVPGIQSLNRIDLAAATKERVS